MMGLNKLTKFDSTVLEKHYFFHFSFCVRVGYMALMAFRHRKESLLKVADKYKKKYNKNRG